MKKNLLNDYEKEIVYNIVMTLKGRTQKQKARFNMYYSLGDFVMNIKNDNEIQD